MSAGSSAFAEAMEVHDRAVSAQLDRAADIGRLHGAREDAATAARLADAAGLGNVAWRHLRAEDLPADLPSVRLVT